LSEEFRKAQREKLGDVHVTLSDLQTALNIALASDDLIRALECVGVYRDTIRSQSITGAIFKAVQDGNFERAIRQASYYRGYWARVLWLYLAWQAAEQGDSQAVQHAMASTGPVNRGLGRSLREALLVRIARTLGRTAGDASSVRAWLGRWNATGDVDRLLETYDLSQPLSPDRRQLLVLALNDHVAEFEKLVSEHPYSDVESSEDLPYEEVDDLEAIAPRSSAYLDEEMLMRTASLEGLLVELAATDEGRANIDALLRLTLPHPYPGYRDISLVTLGVACLAVSDSSWVHPRLQAILETTLNQEGATFTFDLPSILLEEAKKRQLPAQRLSEFLDEALGRADPWGTALRAHSARAAALFRQGKFAEALEVLRETGRDLLSGFSGYRTLTLLTLANRCYEFGEPGLATDASWRSWDKEYEGMSLFDAAERAAASVQDPRFREERLRLVRDYREWAMADTPDLDSALATLSEMADSDSRRIYVDHVSARWTSPSGVNREGLKKLVPMVLMDPTALDAVWGRLLGLSLDELANDDLDQAIRFCSIYFCR
jgi:hypothetical protein